jgi:hypothetical protein
MSEIVPPKAAEVKAALFDKAPRELCCDLTAGIGARAPGLDRHIEIEKVYQLARIADALDNLVNDGIYTYPQPGLPVKADEVPTPSYLDEPQEE